MEKRIHDVIQPEINILLVEDNDGHASLIEKNLRRAGINNTITRARDGMEVFEILFENKEGTVPAQIPFLVLLDLNLPVYSGIQILERMKAEERTKNIPVIVLTTTDDYKEMKRCYELGCNVYITKSVDYTQFSEAIQKIGHLISIIKIPNS